jgi:hypothetical protein
LAVKEYATLGEICNVLRVFNEYKQHYALIIMLKKNDHIGIAVKSIAGTRKFYEQAKKSGCRLIHEAPFKGAGGQQFAFLHPKFSFGVMAEFWAKGEKI